MKSLFLFACLFLLASCGYGDGCASAPDCAAKAAVANPFFQFSVSVNFKAVPQDANGVYYLQSGGDIELFLNSQSTLTVKASAVLNDSQVAPMITISTPAANGWTGIITNAPGTQLKLTVSEVPVSFTVNVVN